AFARQALQQLLAFAAILALQPIEQALGGEVDLLLGQPTRQPSSRQASGGAQNHAPEAMVILGIDPGLASTGYGVVSRRGARLVALDGGVIETAAGVA